MSAPAPFGPIEAAAARRCGGPPALKERLLVPKTVAELSAVPDDRYLSAMCLRIFRAGLKHSVVDAKWPAFEDAFFGFDPARIVALSDEDLDARLADPRLIRHGGKIRAIRDNAAAIRALAVEHGGMGRWLAGWPGTATVALWAELARRFSQLGGNSAPAFLRMVGKDTFLLTDDVVAALVAAGVLAGAAKTRADLARVQAAFDGWAEATGRPYCQISQILALSRG